jgi:hypothetical protein
MGTAFYPHAKDHEIKIDSTTKSLELALDENGRPLYRVITDIPQYRQPLLFTQSTWTGGHRQRDFVDPTQYYEGKNIDTFQDGRVVLGPKISKVGVSGGDLGATPKHFLWYNGISKWMCATTTKVFSYDGTNFVEEEEFAGKTITDLCEFEDIMYVCLGVGTKYYYTANGSDYTQTDLADGYANRMLVAPNSAGTATVLWKFKTPNELSNTTDGRTAGAGGVAWSSPAYIGDTSNDIVNIFLLGDRIMAGKEDNLFYYDSNGGTHPLMNDLNRARSSNNFYYVTEWQSSIYFSLAQGIKEIAANTIESVSPTREATDIGKIGTCVGLVGDRDFLYCGMELASSEWPYTFPFTFSDGSTQTDVTLYKGRESWSGNELRWEWCPWIWVGNNDCDAISVCHHTDTDRRLWYGDGNYAAYSPIRDNPTEEGNADGFNTDGGYLRMSYFYGTDPYWDKLFQSVITETNGCDSGKTVTPKYRKNTEDGSATGLTAAITSDGVNKTNLTSALDCNKIQFQLDLATDDDDYSPEVLYFQARGIEKPEVVRIHEATYKSGSSPNETSETIRDFLRDGGDSTDLIKFADLRWGESTTGTNYHWVVLEPGYPQEVEITTQKGRKPELGIQVRFREVSYTVS